MATPPPSTLSTSLFALSAALSTISIPWHLRFGLRNLDPVLHSTLNATYTQRLARACAEVGWDHMQIGILTGAALNYCWSRTGGPTGIEEKIIFFALLGGGLYTGRKVWVLRQYRPLLCLWVAPVVSGLGWWLGRGRGL